MFGNLFGSSKKEPVTSTVSATSATRSADPQTTIVKLRENINNQEKREEHIQRKVDAMVKEAKTKMGKGDKKGGSFVNDSLDHKCFSVDQNHQLLLVHAPFSFLIRGFNLLDLTSFDIEYGSVRYHFHLVSLYNWIYSTWQINSALFAMKRKKLYEAEIDKIQNVKMTLETQVINLESAAQNAETFKAMQAGSKTMAKIRSEVGIDEVDDIMDSIKEEMEAADEINQAIAQPVDPLMADEDELLEELQELENADLEAELLAPPTKAQEDPLSLPTVPTEALPNVSKAEEDDLKQLEAELAGL
eukprot:CAMPEP_0168767716 /NCGR_PEP_ID=MMETSP0725-20121227/1504_1 /TAXON_ID=265536 /ORGANISM="Amphiprora sp., Strain CCMP467" /LENGTH=301 /DNA_ID=CAMNT_0008817051 /DNA_START=84 /DNA_END=991 /DNA_ORIENTATION=-